MEIYPPVYRINTGTMEGIRLNRFCCDTFDDYIDMVQEDPNLIDKILESNEDIKGDLEPLLRTAVWLDGFQQRKMMPELKKQYRQRAIMSGLNGLEPTKKAS